MVIIVRISQKFFNFFPHISCKFLLYVFIRVGSTLALRIRVGKYINIDGHFRLYAVKSSARFFFCKKIKIDQILIKNINKAVCGAKNNTWEYRV